MTTVCPSAHCPNLRPCPTHGAAKPHGRGWKWSRVTVPAVLARDRHTCVLCGKPCPHPKHHHVGHIVDRDHGGSDTDEMHLPLQGHRASQCTLRTDFCVTAEHVQAALAECLADALEAK